MLLGVAGRSNEAKKEIQEKMKNEEQTLNKIQILKKGEKSILILMTRVRQSFFDNKFFVKLRCHVQFDDVLNACVQIGAWSKQVRSDVSTGF